jgi:hypothetical protein
MKAYVSVLDDVICLEEIKKIRIKYSCGTDYRNNWKHFVFVTYKDGTEEEYVTTDFEKAKQDYENLKFALLGIDMPNPTEKGGAE